MDFTANLHKITVRNTFLEFDVGGDDLLPDSGLARQASEPAKPSNRQVSEQTTAGGSGAAHDEACTEAEEHTYAQLASFLAQSIPSAPGQGGSGTACGFGDRNLQAVFQQSTHTPTDTSSHFANAACSPMSSVEVQAAQCEMTIVRFCPNCGAEVEPNHRFCPFCCYQLHSFQVGGGPLAGFGGQPGGGVFPNMPGGGPQGTLGQLDRRSGPPKLLESLRRFRFIEANPTDIEFARAMCSQISLSKNAA
mmetsp:Transcript_19320/g.55384  ORF Transcript_19320/g.55384 Transcript_19320/m.55384 type:complete len:249 (-) Transcript_19320:340-1086(-)